MLIFDNVDFENVENVKAAEFVKAFISRARRLDLYNIKSVELDVSSDDEAIAFMKLSRRHGKYLLKNSPNPRWQSEMEAC